MIEAETLIMALAGIVIILSLILVTKIIRNQPTVAQNPWEIPPMNPVRQRTRVGPKTLTPPPPHVFRER